MVQKKQEITYRELRKEDYPRIENILGETWGFARRCRDQKVAKLLEKYYWASLLAQENFARTALINGRPVGIVLAKKEGKGGAKPGMRLRSLIYALRLLINQEGRENLKVFRELNRQNREMFKKTGEKFDGELVYLNIMRNKRGRGMGTRLWEDAKDFIKNLAGKNGKIVEIKKSKQKENPPLLFNLAEIQNQCTKKFKIKEAEEWEPGSGKMQRTL